MKTKIQKTEELKRAEELLGKSKFLAFAEFSGVSAEDVRKLRRSAKEAGASILMLKKRLLAIALKNKGVDFDTKGLKTSIGTVFADDVEKSTGAVYKFFANLGETKDEKAANIKKILGGYDLATMSPLDASRVIAIGQLPPRDVLMAQLMGMFVAPLRTFMYMVNEIAKSKGAPSPASADLAAEVSAKEVATADKPVEVVAEESQAEIPAEPNSETVAEEKAESAS